MTPRVVSQCIYTVENPKRWAPSIVGISVAAGSEVDCIDCSRAMLLGPCRATSQHVAQSSAVQEAGIASDRSQYFGRGCVSKSEEEGPTRCGRHAQAGMETVAGLGSRTVTIAVDSGTRRSLGTSPRKAGRDSSGEIYPQWVCESGSMTGEGSMVVQSTLA
jgi:hypothetical protein